MQTIKIKLLIYMMTLLEMFLIFVVKFIKYVYLNCTQFICFVWTFNLFNGQSWFIGICGNFQSSSIYINLKYILDWKFPHIPINLEVKTFLSAIFSTPFYFESSRQCTCVDVGINKITIWYRYK